MAKSNEQESETSELVKPLREIPFRLMAQKREFNEAVFIKRAYITEPYVSSFLSNQCTERFAKAATKLLVHPVVYRRYVNMKKAEKKTIKLAKSYSRVVAESIMNTSKPISTAEYLSNISPSAPTNEFIEYSTVDFETNFPPRCFKFEAECQAFLVDVFLRQFSDYDEVFVFMMIFLNMEPAEATQLKRQCERAKKLQKAMDKKLQRQNRIAQMKAAAAESSTSAAEKPSTSAAAKPSTSASKTGPVSKNTRSYFTHFPKLAKPDQS